MIYFHQAKLHSLNGVMLDGMNVGLLFVMHFDSQISNHVLLLGTRTYHASRNPVIQRQQHNWLKTTRWCPAVPVRRSMVVPF